MEPKSHLPERWMEVALGIAAFVVLSIVVVLLIRMMQNTLAERIWYEVKLDRIFEHNSNMMLRMSRVLERTHYDQDCSPNQCLIRDGKYGMATITGYHEKRTRVGIGDVNEECDAFVIMGGSPHFVETYDEGSPVGPETGEMTINLNLLPIQLASEDEYTLLLESSPENNVDLTVLRPITVPRGVDPCHSSVDILEVSDHF